MIIKGFSNFCDNSFRVSICDSEGEKEIPFLNPIEILESDIFKRTGFYKPVLFALEGSYEESLGAKRITISEHFSNEFVNTGIFQVEYNYSDFICRLFDYDLGLGSWFNQNSQELTLVRDIFGLIPLYYCHIPSVFFAFSTNFSDLIENSEVRNYLTLDKITIYNYLTRNDHGKYYGNGTFFNEIKSVYPGHYIKVSPTAGIKEVSYFDFNPEKYRESLSSLEQFGQLFREKFGHSIEKIIEQTQDKDVVGLQLSGGLDSSSVSSMIRWLYPERQLKTFFLQSTSYRNIDNEYAEIVSKHIESDHMLVELNPDLKKIFFDNIKRNGMPSYLVSAGIPGTLLRNRAQKEGLSSLLSGHGGDEIVGYGNEYFDRLYKNEDWFELQMECIEFIKQGGKSKAILSRGVLTDEEKAKLVFNAYIFKKILEYKNLNNILQKLYSIGRFDTVLYFVKSVFKQILKRNYQPKVVNEKYTSGNFLVNIQDEKLFNGFLTREVFYTKGGTYFGDFFFNLTLKINEDFFNLNHNHDVKLYFPFVDRDLFEASIAVPDSLKFDSGRSRGHMREAMKEILPEKVRMRRDKFVFTSFVRNISLAMNDEITDLLREGEVIWNYANYKTYIESIRDLKQVQGEDFENIGLIRKNTYVLRVINLAIWLEEFKEIIYDSDKNIN